MTVKVFNERGRESAGEVRIPYEQGRQEIKVLFARTIRPDGTVVTVGPEDIHDQGYGNGNDYTDARLKAFSMPALEPGAIVDYQYVTEDKAPYLPGQFWSGWFFAGLEPVKLSRLTITAPKGMALRSDLTNATGIDKKQAPSPDGKSTVYTWEMKNPEPLQPEPMMPSPESVIPQLHVSTLSGWQQVADLYWKLAQDRMTANDEIKKITAEVTKGKTTPEDKARAIFYYVQDKTRYVAKELGIGAIQPRPAALTCTNRYGDCKDMTTLLVAMMREAGVTAHPVLLKAGSREQIRDKVPGLSAFNHAICLAEIGGKKYWLDATAQVCPFGDVPGGDRGCDVLVIREGKGAFETIPHFAPEENALKTVARLKLQPDGSANGKVTISGTGDKDLALRFQLASLPPDRVKQYGEQIARQLAPNAKINDCKVSDFRDKDKRITIDLDVTFPSWAKKSGDLLIFQARPDQTGGGGSSPFGQDTVRSLPITQENAGLAVTELEVTLPDGHTFLSPPNPAQVKSDLGRFERKVSVTGNTLNIAIIGQDNRASVPAARYEEVRAYFDGYLKAIDESVVVKKQ
jgi:hypothetical protein